MIFISCRPPACKTMIAAAYGALLSQGRLHRHLAMAHRRAGRKTFRRIDDGVCVDTVVAIEVVDRAGLAEMLDTERFDPGAMPAAEPAERCRVTVDHRDDAAIARKLCQQFFDVAEMRN